MFLIVSFIYFFFKIYSLKRNVLTFVYLWNINFIWKMSLNRYTVVVYFFMRTMKDLLKRCCIWLISGGFLWYLAYLFMKGIVFVQGWLPLSVSRYYLIITLIFVFLFIFFALYPVHFKMNKATLFLVWLCLLVLGDTIFINTPEQGVFVGDLLKLLGVLLILLAWTNVLITDKVNNDKKMKKIEIIEV